MASAVVAGELVSPADKTEFKHFVGVLCLFVHAIMMSLDKKLMIICVVLFDLSLP